MRNPIENPSFEKPDKNASLESSGAQKEKAEAEIDPELMESIKEEIDKEKNETKKPISLFPKKLQKVLAIALLGLTIGSGIMAREAEAGQSRVGRDAESAVGNVIKDAGRGAGSTVRDIFERMWGGQTSKSRDRIDRINERAMEREIRIQQMERERFHREYQREIREAINNYERERQTAQRELVNGLRKAKTLEERQSVEGKHRTLLEAADLNYQAAIKVINERYGIPTAPEAQNNPVNPSATPENPQGSEKSGSDKSQDNITYVQ